MRNKKKRSWSYVVRCSQVKLSLSQEALTAEEQLLEEKDAELRRVQKEVEALLQESKTHLQALEEEKERNRIQVMSSRVLSAAV